MSFQQGHHLREMWRQVWPAPTQKFLSQTHISPGTGKAEMAPPASPPSSVSAQSQCRHSHLKLSWQSPSQEVPISPRLQVGVRGRETSPSSCPDLLTPHLPTLGIKASESLHIFLAPQAFFLVSSPIHSLCPPLPFHFFSFYLTPRGSEGANISFPSGEKRFYDRRWSNRTKVCSKCTGTRKQPCPKELGTQLDPMFSWRLTLLENSSKKCFSLLELLEFALSLLISHCSCVTSLLCDIAPVSPCDPAGVKPYLQFNELWHISAASTPGPGSVWLWLTCFLSHVWQEQHTWPAAGLFSCDSSLGTLLLQATQLHWPFSSSAEQGTSQGQEGDVIAAVSITDLFTVLREEQVGV